MALETTAARLAAERATDEDIEALRAALEEQTPSTATLSLDFHTTLVGASHNRALLIMFSATRALIREAFDALHARQPDMVETARRVHTALYAAIEKRDADAAVRLMREHMLDFAARAERAEEGS
jgi:GntR family transcriptional repressor for pyruvate dehydrogenase complex